MSTISDFMNKAVRTYKSGRENAAPAERPLLLKSAMSPQKPIEKKKSAAESYRSCRIFQDIRILGEDDAERGRIYTILERLSKSEEGQALIDQAAGTRIQMRTMNAQGSYSFSESNKRMGIVFLNRDRSDDYLVAVAAHEMKHHRQITSEHFVPGAKRDIFSSIYANRVMEADASATACLVVQQLKDTDPKVAESMRKFSNNKNYFKAFEASLAENPNDVSGAMNKAFFGFFENREYIGRYDRSLVEAFIAEAERYPSLTSSKMTRAQDFSKAREGTVMTSLPASDFYLSNKDMKDNRLRTISKEMYDRLCPIVLKSMHEGTKKTFTNFIVEDGLGNLCRINYSVKKDSFSLQEREKSGQEKSDVSAVLNAVRKKGNGNG